MAIHYRINAGALPPTHWQHDPEIGGGRIIGEACHFIDFITFLVGSIPTQVTAFVLPDEGRYHRDNVIIQLKYRDGSLGTISYLANGDKNFSKERVEVFCGGKIAILDDFRSLELNHDGARTILRSSLRQDKGHAAAWQAFLDSIKHGSTPSIPYDQILSGIEAPLAVNESIENGKIIDMTYWRLE
jgi:predicted dehydrogenase